MQKKFRKQSSRCTLRRSYLSFNFKNSQENIFFGGKNVSSGVNVSDKQSGV